MGPTLNLGTGMTGPASVLHARAPHERVFAYEKGQQAYLLAHEPVERAVSSR
jgi:hypothetical protein